VTSPDALNWETVREDEADELKILFQRASTHPNKWRLCCAGFEDVEELTQIFEEGDPHTAAQKYMEYRSALRTKGLAAFLPIEIPGDVQCTNLECKQLREQQWWRHCPRCGTRFPD